MKLWYCHCWIGTWMHLSYQGALYFFRQPSYLASMEWKLVGKIKHCSYSECVTLPETNITSGNLWMVGRWMFLSGWPIFRVLMLVSECVRPASIISFRTWKHSFSELRTKVTLMWTGCTTGVLGYQVQLDGCGFTRWTSENCGGDLMGETVQNMCCSRVLEVGYKIYQNENQTEF